jgi:6-phosphogluconolactonase
MTMTTIKFYSKFLAAPLLALLFTCCSTRDHDFLIYVGTYTDTGSEGIYVYRFNSTAGHITPIGLAATATNPSYLVADEARKYLYTVNETSDHEGKNSGAISVFSMDHESGDLKLLQQVSSQGAAPCYLSIDRSGRYLMVANYSGGSTAIFPITPDGRLGKVSSFVQHVGFSVNPERQNSPHTHAIQATTDNRFVTVTDLGTDKVLVYPFDAERGFLDTTRSSHVLLPPGSGPRHLAFSGDAKTLYILNELTSNVAVFSWNSDTGALEPKQTVPILPDNFTGINTAAEILVDAGGKFLYVSNRGDDSIGVFRIESVDGRLTLVDWFPCGGRGPRHMEIDPTGKWLMVANQYSDNLSLFKIDASTGRLTPSGKPQKVSAPVCVRFVPVN